MLIKALLNSYQINPNCFQKSARETERGHIKAKMDDSRSVIFKENCGENLRKGKKDKLI